MLLILPQIYEMSLENRIKSFATLGSFLTQFGLKHKHDELTLINNRFYDEMENAISNSKQKNGWFTQDNCLLVLSAWGNALQKEKLEKWTSKYTFSNQPKKRVGIIMAGNIPLVGLHDFISVLISGHYAVVKTSKDDSLLIRKIAEILCFLNPEYTKQISFVDKLENIDAVIATGSNNSAQHFEYYFGKYPNIIRRNRNSVAIITGGETKKELELLGTDIFQYFGLGCRNVSKLYVPENYKFDAFFEAVYPFNNVINNNKYANNYDYNRAVFLLGKHNLLDNNFLLLKEDTQIATPVAVLNFEYYFNTEKLLHQLESQNDEIQCVVSHLNNSTHIKFGCSQSPELWDYADNRDTLQFLLELR